MIFLLLILLLLPSFIILYFLPALIAKLRNHHNFQAIFVLNLLFGWSFIGWGIALIWSVARICGHSQNVYTPVNTYATPIR